MRGDFENSISREWYNDFDKNTPYIENADTLWTKLFEKENEASVYKERLKELEIAFNYNLELISERDLELHFLEKQLRHENERFQQIVKEKNELEEILKSFDDKNVKKIQHLEIKLSIKEAEIKELQRKNISYVAFLKNSFEEAKQLQRNQIHQLANKYEKYKNEFMKKWQEETEEKEKYYLFEIDNLAGQLQEASRIKEKMAKVSEENQHLKSLLKNAKKLFQKKESFDLKELKMKSNCQKINDKYVDKDIQCNVKVQVNDEKIQVEPKVSRADTQTTRFVCDSEENYKKKVNFLQEQNEVLKCVIKDLKKNRCSQSKAETEEQLRECMECKTIKAEIEKVNEKFEQEISNLKKFIEDEKKERADEETVIQSLETSVTYLKEKLLMSLEEKLKDKTGI